MTGQRVARQRGFRLIGHVRHEQFPGETHPQPGAAEDSPLVAAAERLGVPAGRNRILIAGCDEVLQESLRAVLNTTGRIIQLAPDSAQAARTFSRHAAAFALVVIEQQLPVAVFSMEMGATQLAMRMLCSSGRLDQQRIRTGRLIDDDWPRLTSAISKMQEAPLHIDESPALTALELRARARRLARQCGKLGLIVIDYLQLMSASTLGENRATEISEISRSLKALAKELDCPVIALSQLNRSLEQRPNKRPVMSDLRESGAIEQDADVVMFIYRDEVYHPDTEDKGVAEILVSKHRNGPTGIRKLVFLEKFACFGDLSRHESV